MGQYHNLKDLASAINIEASELQELFLWKKSEESDAVFSEKKEKIEQEVADIFVYLIMFCYKSGIDIEDIVRQKMQHNAQKYPIEKVKGKSKKYNAY